MPVSMPRLSDATFGRSLLLAADEIRNFLWMRDGPDHDLHIILSRTGNGEITVIQKALFEVLVHLDVADVIVAHFAGEAVNDATSINAALRRNR